MKLELESEKNKIRLYFENLCDDKSESGRVTRPFSTEIYEMVESCTETKKSAERSASLSEFSPIAFKQRDLIKLGR